MRETAEAPSGNVGVQVASIASKCTKGLQLMEAMGFKDRGSFTNQIGGMQDEESDDEDELLL